MTHEKPKSTLKGLRHGFVGLGTLWAVTEMKVRIYEQRAQQQLTEGLETLPTAPADETRQVKKSDYLAEGIRAVLPYVLSRSMSHSIENDRTRRFTAAMLTNAIVAVPEMWRMEERANIYTNQTASSQQLSLVPKKMRSSGDNKFLATLDRVAPFILYETVITTLSEYLIKPYVSDFVKDKLTFVSTEKEVDVWSDFLTELLLRCTTVPLEKLVKQSLAGVEPKAQAPTDQASEKKQSSSRWNALLKTVALTVPFIAPPLVHLYAYRGLSSAFDSMGL